MQTARNPFSEVAGDDFSHSGGCFFGPLQGPATAGMAECLQTPLKVGQTFENLGGTYMSPSFASMEGQVAVATSSFLLATCSS